MKILNLSYDDYSNFAYDNCEALLSVGIDAHSLKRVKHPFDYANQSKVATSTEIQREIQKADIVQLFHSDSTWLDYAFNLGKRVYVYHTGTNYRQNSEYLNTVFNPKVEACFTDQCEFIGLGMKNETYIATAIDTDRFKPLDWHVATPYSVAHFPSHPVVKGTGKILEMMGTVSGSYKFIHSDARVNHQEQMLRMSGCDIYIELFSLMQNDKNYGCFGVTAFEAAALGKIVITNNVFEESYRSAYGDCALVIANCETSFKTKMEWLLQLSQPDLRDLQQKSREWVVSKHSYKATGERLIKLLNL